MFHCDSMISLSVLLVFPKACFFHGKADVAAITEFIVKQLSCHCLCPVLISQNVLEGLCDGFFGFPVVGIDAGDIRRVLGVWSE